MFYRLREYYRKRGQWIEGYHDFLFKNDSPLSVLAGEAWSLQRIAAGEDVEQALLDLSIILAHNLETVLTSAALGGDVVSVLGSGNAYSVAFETILPSGLYPGRGRQIHFKYANQALLEAMNSDPTFAAGMNELIPNIAQQISKAPGIYNSPTGWTWHHNPYQPGLMQWVPTIQHRSPLLRWLFLDANGNGGFANWVR
jgi:hypothetical protein